MAPGDHRDEHIPPTGGAILASNHLSIVDSIFLPLMLDRPLTFAAKSEYFTGNGLHPAARPAPTCGPPSSCRWTGTSSRAAQDMLDAALALLRSGELFGIYPEGTRSPDGRLYRGRTGVAWLALNSGLPVIPVAMIGTDRILPPGHAVPRLHRISIRIGEPLTFEAYQGETAGAGSAGRSPTRSIQAIQKLSGQEYVPIYASVRKAELNGGKAAPPRQRSRRLAADLLRHGLAFLAGGRGLERAAVAARRHADGGGEVAAEVGRAAQPGLPPRPG